ncbi:cytochrome c maturation protein CcmE [Gilvimarinus sp. F26214L]|uniref:cytochrome c maturation protein CcmE n=1 Tax=Gilvimarinus sp. DZF01 TaxID=3461371 RepID=UPI0040465473
MHPVRKQRLIFVLFLVFFAGAAAALFGFALRENIDLFYPPSAIVAGQAPVDKQIRAGGCVLPGSIQRQENSMTKTFVVTDGAANLSVTTDVILPDLFGEGESAVLTGKLNGEGVFVATQVLAKHDETYMPPEVADNLQNPQDHAKTCEGLDYGS